MDDVSGYDNIRATWQGATGVDRTLHPGVVQVDKAAQQIGAVAFIHRFGSSLNEHVHFHVCVVDGVFVALAGGADAGVDTDTDTQAVADGQSSPSKVIFHPASGIDEIAVAQVQATLRTRILRAFVGSRVRQFKLPNLSGFQCNQGLSNVFFGIV